MSYRRLELGCLVWGSLVYIMLEKNKWSASWAKIRITMIYESLSFFKKNEWIDRKAVKLDEKIVNWSQLNSGPLLYKALTSIHSKLIIKNYQIRFLRYNLKIWQCLAGIFQVWTKSLNKNTDLYLIWLLSSHKLIRQTSHKTKSIDVALNQFGTPKHSVLCLFRMVKIGRRRRWYYGSLTLCRLSF